MALAQRLDSIPAGRAVWGAAPDEARIIGAAEAIAADLNASEFAAFFIGAGRERGRLTPVVDSDFPARSVASTILSSTFGDAFVKRASSSTMPSWWSGERESPSTRALEALKFADRTALGLPDVPGIAFPVHSRTSALGLIVFLGTDITVTDRTMPLVHAACFKLFREMDSLGLCPAERLPQVTARELDCLRLTADGYTSDEIATALSLSVHTANQYLSKVTLKLDAVNRMHAVAKALRLGLIE